jgi:hypothetical protein
MRSFACSPVSLPLPLLIAAVHTAVLTAPSFAFAQTAQPVPYNPAPAPVPYGPPASTPPATAQPQPASRALAASPGSDVIYLKNGGILRGTIIDAIPNAQARIQLATGEIATVPWSEVSRFEHASTAPAAPAAPAPAPPPASRSEPSKREAAPVGLTVHIDSPSAVELQHKGPLNGGSDGETPTWHTVCSSPCDRRLPSEGHYRIVGDGARPSRDFMLPEGTGTVTLAVSPSSSGWFVGGIVLMSVGGITMLVGLLIGLVGSLASTVDSSGTAQDWATGGWAAFGLGAAGLIVGIIALASNVHTGVTISNGATTEGAVGSPWAHVATFRDGRDAPPESRAAPAVGATLLRLSF